MTILGFSFKLIQVYQLNWRSTRHQIEADGSTVVQKYGMFAPSEPLTLMLVS
jgi:hypothetical protein